MLSEQYQNALVLIITQTPFNTQISWADFCPQKEKKRLHFGNLHMNVHKQQQELPSPLGVHFELKAACEPVILLLWEQPGQNKSAIYFCLQPSCRNAFPNPIPT